MFHGENNSGKEFDVIDEDGELLGSFNHHGDAVKCLRAAPWFAGECRVRVDKRYSVATVSCADATRAWLLGVTLTSPRYADL